MKRLALLVLSLFVAGCRDHELEDGAYVISEATVIRDDCGLAQVGAEVLTGTMRRTGHIVYLTLDAPALQLTGAYKTNLEAFYLDGTVLNFSTQIQGQQCLLDTMAFHLEAETIDPTSFQGQLQVSTTTQQNDACVCKHWFDFTARRL